MFRKYEPEEGYFLAFSGGKDSTVIHHLAVLAGVRFQAFEHAVKWWWENRRRKQFSEKTAENT